MFEKKDVNGFILVLLSVVFIGSGILIRTELKEYFGRLKQKYPSAQVISKVQVGPLLQAFPEKDLATYLEKERLRLESYEWVDRKRAIARIPIERAMEIQAHE